MTYPFNWPKILIEAAIEIAKHILDQIMKEDNGGSKGNEKKG